MNDLLDRGFEDAIRGALTDDAERAPHAPEWWGPIAAVTPPSRVRWVAVAASVLVIAVVGTVAVLVTRTDDTPALTAATTTHPTPTSPPESTTDTATASTATTVTLVESGSCIDGSYILQDGDTPAGLAVKFDLSVEALDFANVHTPGYDDFIVGTRVLIPTAGAGCQPAPIGDGAAIVVTMPPDSTDAQIALVRAVLDDLGAPIDATRTEFWANGDAAVFFVFADPAADPTTIYDIAEELRHLPGVSGVARPMN